LRGKSVEAADIGVVLAAMALRALLVVKPHLLAERAIVFDGGGNDRQPIAPLVSLEPET
jgi:hypothetical protein